MTDLFDAAESPMELMLAKTERAGAEFDYADLPSDLATDARDAAERIKGRLRQSIVETGRDLIAVKERMAHGAFGAWIKAELSFTARTAENFMNAAKFLAGKSETLSLLPPAVIYQIAAPSAPAAVVNEIMAAADKKPPSIRSR